MTGQIEGSWDLDLAYTRLSDKTLKFSGAYKGCIRYMYAGLRNKKTLAIQCTRVIGTSGELFKYKIESELKFGREEWDYIRVIWGMVTLMEYKSERYLNLG